MASAMICVIAAASALGVLARPWRTSEALWACGGAALLLGIGLITPAEALAGLGKALDVCLFLAGMMLLSEVARLEGLFDAVAVLAVNLARGSPRRLFALVYAAGVVVTVFLSNDATAVVLTPAVFAAAKRAKTEPLPHLFACAMVANAASFALPISNPANLVLYASRPPPLGAWLASFGAASLVAIAATFLALRLAERNALGGRCEARVPQPPATRGGRAAIVGLAATVAVLLAVSAAGWPLGWPTALMGALTAAAALLARRSSPLPLLKDVHWPILPLVAGLFVLVEGLARAGIIARLAGLIQASAAAHPGAAAWSAGALIALASNLINNLPAGLMASAAALQAHPPRFALDSLLIGVDLGPNLSVTGSLATILWLAAIRREGEHVTAWRFLKTGALVMPPALILALAARWLAA